MRITAEKTSLINSVINNILTNAIKFSYPDGIIEIQSKKQGDNIILSIRDHGIGIPKEMLNTLFDVNQSFSRKGTVGEDGTGFGMPLVRKFMSAYGGEIIIKSVESEGTEIILAFI